MDKADLYKLPKDILVKLITTIQEDTIKKFQKDLREKFKNKGGIVKSCPYLNCDTYFLIDQYDQVLYTNIEEKYYHCGKCWDYYCSKDHARFKKLNGREVCSYCFDNSVRFGH